MKTKIVTIVALCVSALTPVAFPTAAMAAILPPIDELNAICSATTVVNPAANSTFRAELNTATIVTTPGPVYELSRVTITNIPGGQLLSQVGPTYVGPQGRNGQSPNIFGTFETVSTYSGGLLVQEVTTAQDTTFTYGCRVFKTQNGNLTEPRGLQVEGLTLTRTENLGSATETVSAPDVLRTELSEKVTCNSPLRNPGVWRQQNGYTGVCSTELFMTLSQIEIHSNSLPPLVTMSARADHSSSSASNDSGPATVFDEWTEEAAS